MPDEPTISPKKRHLLYSVPWLGYACIAFSVMFAVLGLAALQGSAEDSVFTTLAGLFALLSLPLFFLAFISSVGRWLGKGSDYPEPNIKWHRRVMGTCFVFSIIGFMVPMFRTALIATRHASDRSTAEIAANEPWVQNLFGAGEFVIETPSNWVQTDIPAFGNNGFQLTDEFNQLVVVVCATPKSDVTVESLDVLHQMAVANIKKRGANHAVNKSAEGIRSGYRVNQTMVEWENGTQKLVTVTRQYDFPNHWVEMDLSCTPSSFSKYEDRLTKIADSIKLNTSPATR